MLMLCFDRSAATSLFMQVTLAPNVPPHLLIGIGEPTLTLIIIGMRFKNSGCRSRKAESEIEKEGSELGVVFIKSASAGAD